MYTLDAFAVSMSEHDINEATHLSHEPYKPLRNELAAFCDMENIVIRL